jgi:hypothetical protein
VILVGTQSDTLVNIASALLQLNAYGAGYVLVANLDALDLLTSNSTLYPVFDGLLCMRHAYPNTTALTNFYHKYMADPTYFHDDSGGWYVSIVCGANSFACDASIITLTALICLQD